MRVLHVIDSLDLRMGGTARAALDTCAGLLTQGVEVSLVSTAASGEDLSHLTAEYAEVPSRVFDRHFPTHNFRSPSLRRWLDANVEHFDLVDVHGVFSLVPLYASRACRRSGTPYTVRPHGSLDPFDLQKHAVAKKALGPTVFRRLLHGAAALILTSQSEADRVVTFGADAPKSVLPLPVPPPRQRGDGAQFRADHRIPADALVVLLLGRIHPKKGLQFLLPSLAALKRSFPRLWFMAVGTGEPAHMKEMDRLLHEYDMMAWTTCCDFVTGQTKQSAFAAADVFALPSLNENFGIAVVEAMYAGLPILVSSEVYIHDIVLAEGAGVACEPSLASCRSALQQLVTDDAGRREMCLRGPQAAHRHFAPQHAVRALAKVYEELVAVRGGLVRGLG